jgi:signal transduction histidine kinase
MHHSHQPVLVVFSIVIAILASYAALELTVSMAEQARHRFAWIGAGALAEGTGIWSMHFVAMLAFTIPGVEIRYNVPLLILSFSVAVAGAAVALFAATASRVTRWVTVVCALAMGAAIAGLHYTSIAAMRMPVDYTWNHLLVTASVAIAVVASGAAIWLSIRFRSSLSLRGFLIRGAAGLVLGGAIVGMHYTAMAAMVFLRPSSNPPEGNALLATSGLASAVIGASNLILGVALAGCGIQRALALDRQRARTREALDAIRSRDEFLSIAAHELHTPIHSMQLVVQGVRSGAVARKPDRVERAFGIVERQARRLTGLVDTLLDVSRMQEGKLELHVDAVDLVAVAEESLEQLAPDIQAAGCAVSVQRPGGPVVGRWDRLRLEQVVVNLLSNAAKFGRGAPIDVAIERANGVARLAVRDRGIGIPADRLKAVFERFERAVPAEQYGGLGLGLYIVRTLVRMMGGSVEVESSVGMGSTFVLTLPLQAREAA